MKLIVTLTVFAVSIAVTNAATNVLMCYYGSWAHYKKDEAKVTVDDLSGADKCTHIIYSFVSLTSDGKVLIRDTYLEIDLKALEKLSQLKNSNPNLKVMVAVGGWGVGSAPFSTVAANRNLRETFAKDVVQFMETYKLDGFDLDWEYPASREGSRAEDKQNFIELIKELRKQFEPKGWLLTAAVGATKAHRATSYDVKSMSQYLDYINVMAYDLHNHMGGRTAFNAPLYAEASEEGQELNVYDVMQGWIKDGAKPEKLVMGIAFYGRSFALSNPSNHEVGAPTSGAGTPGEFTQEGGILSYLEICKRIKNQGWKHAFDDKQQVPYAYNGNQWVGYDDVKSIQLKVEAAKKLNLGGVMMWAIEQDDIRNTCGGGSFPLLNAMSQSLGGKSSPGSEVSKPTKKSSKPKHPTKLPVATTTPASINVPDNGGVCNSYQPDPSNCQFYYVCDAGNNKHRMQCAEGTLFDKNIQVCNHANLVKC